MGLERFCFWSFLEGIAEYHLSKCGDNWTTNKRETEEYTLCPKAYISLKYSSLNRVNSQRLTQ